MGNTTRSAEGEVSLATAPREQVEFVPTSGRKRPRSQPFSESA